MMPDLRTAARILGGEVTRGQALCPGPGHSPQDRSLAVRFDRRSPDGFVVESFSGDDFATCRDYVRDRLGIRRAGRRREVLPADPAPRPPVAVSNAGDAERTARAIALWRGAHDPCGTPVEAYLASRGLALPSGAAGEAVRWHRSCPFGGSRTPAMLALVRDVTSNRPRAIHRTAITSDGRKGAVNGECRLGLGPVGGGAVKLTPDEDITVCLGIGEGIESTLSLRLVPEFGAGPVWALLSAGQVAAFPVLAGIECLWIAVDHDPAGIRAADAVAQRWRTAGREVFRVTPRAARADLNDLVRAPAC